MGETRLPDVRELVQEQRPTLGHLGSVRARREHDVVLEGVRARVERCGGCRCTRISVHADVREVVTERAFGCDAHARVQ